MAVNVNGQPLSFVADIDDKQYRIVIERMKKDITSVTQVTAQQSQQMASLVKQAMGVAAGYLTVQGVQSFLSNMVKVRGEFQQLEVAFGVMLKSKEKADSLMKDIVQFAATTPFGLQETAGAAKQLLAYGSSAEGVTKELRMLGDVAAGVSAPIGDIVYLYGTLRTQGRAFTQDIRQFAGRGIPIYKELANVLGIAEDKVAEFVEAGKVGFPEIQKAFQNMTKEGGQFAGLMEAQSKTITGQISNLKDSLDQMFNAIGQSQEGAISTAISGVAYLIDHYEDIGKILGVLIATYGAYKAAIIATAAVQKAMDSLPPTAEMQRAELNKINAETTLNVARAIAAKTSAIAADEVATLSSMRVEVSALAVKKEAALAAQQAALATLNAAELKLIAATQEGNAGKIAAAQNKVNALAEKELLLRKQAVAAQSQFSAAKIQLETQAKVTNIATTRASAAAKGVEAAQIGVDTAAINLNAAATKKASVVQGIWVAVTNGATKAFRGLWATLAANPIALIASLAAMTISMGVFAEKAQIGRDKAALLAEANDKLGDKMAETRAKIEPYLQALNKANVTEAERARIYGELQKIDPKIVAGLDAKTLSYQKLKTNVDGYIESLRNQIRAEANSQAAIESIKQEQQIEKQIEEAKKQRDFFKEHAGREDYENDYSYKRAHLKVGELVIQLNKQREVTKSLFEDQNKLNKVAEPPEKIVKNYKYWEDQAKAAQDAIQALDAAQKKGTPEWNKQVALYKDAQKHLAAYNLNSNAAAKAEDQYATMLDKKNDALQHVLDAQNKYNNLFKEDIDAQKAEIDQRYAKEIKKIGEVNEQLKHYNKTAVKKIELIPQSEIDKLTKLRDLEKTAAESIDLAKKEIEQIQAKQALYDDYQKAVKDGNQQLADSIAEQYDLKGFKTYADYVESEYNKLLSKVSEKGGLTGLSAGEVQKYKQLTTIMQGLNKDMTEAQRKEFIELVNNALTTTADYTAKQAEIERKYNEIIKGLTAARRSMTETELQERLELAKQIHDDEVKDLKLQMWRQTQIYKLATTDTTLFTKEELQKRLDDLKKHIDSPEFKKLGVAQQRAIKEAYKTAKTEVDQLKEFAGMTVEELLKVGAALDLAASLFGELAGAIGDSNAGLADTLNTLSQIASIGSALTGLIAGIITLNPVQIVQSVVKIATAVITMWSAAKKSAEEARKKIQEFNDQQFIAEYKINQLLRQRLLMQADEVELTLAKIKAQKQALLLSQQQSKADEASLLAALQGQQYITGMTTEKYGGFLGLARKTRAVNQYGSLLGMTYEQIEKLYESGQLDGKAKDLFEQLKKVHEEGADIDKQLRDLQKQAAEVWTGTTADSILDSIVQGFADGQKSAADFAGNFEDMMRQAMINSLKYKYLEPYIADFYKQFAEFAQSDEVLTQAEIEELKRNYNAMIADVSKQFDQLQQVTGISVGSSQSGTNSLTGAIKGMTEQQAELLAGQFGGLRMTAIDQLNIATRSLMVHQQIEANTRPIAALLALWQRLELNGLKVK